MPKVAAASVAATLLLTTASVAAALIASTPLIGVEGGCMMQNEILPPCLFHS